MRIDPARLVVLHAVASTGSVGAAARQLRLVPSGISQHLAALERETGLSLVDRSRRGGQRPVTLTAAGRRLAAGAARLSAELEAIELDIARSTEAVLGDVTLAVFPTALRHLVLPAHDLVQVQHAGVRVRIVEIDESSALKGLHSGEIDVALLEREAGDTVDLPRLHLTHLLDDRYLLAVPEDWATPDRLHDLGDREWIQGPPSSVTARILERHRVATGLPFGAAHSCLDYPAVLDLVGAGLGAALVPAMALHDQPPRVKIVPLPGLGGRAVYGASVILRRQRQVTRAVLDSLQSAAVLHGRMI